MERGLPKIVTKSGKGGEGVTQYGELTHSVFHANHLFHFFIFVNHITPPVSRIIFFMF